MRDIPIIYSGAMVRAMLEGRKTMTRRILSRENLRVWTDGLDHAGRYVKPDAGMMKAALNNARDFRIIDGRLVWVTDPAPHQVGAAMAQWMGRLTYDVGDRLWVRENLHQPEQLWRYQADGTQILVRDGRCREFFEAWRNNSVPSIHMPRWASRLTQVVTAVKVERLKDMTPDDAFAESVCSDGDVCWVEGLRAETYTTMGPVEAFKYLWQHLHGRNAWDENPYVVALTSTVHHQNIDALPKSEAA